MLARLDAFMSRLGCKPLGALVSYICRRHSILPGQIELVFFACIVPPVSHHVPLKLATPFHPSRKNTYE